MTHENLIKLAKHNLEFFHNESDLADYVAYLFSELSALDDGWGKHLKTISKNGYSWNERLSFALLVASCGVSLDKSNLERKHHVEL